MAEQDKKKRALFSDCITLPPYPTHLYWCRYWLSSKKSGLRPSLNGSIRPLKWNRNVIRNQCIRTCLDIFDNATSHFHPPSPLPLNMFLPLHLHHNHNSMEEEVWISPKNTIMSASAMTACCSSWVHREK